MRVILYDKKTHKRVADLNDQAIRGVALVRAVLPRDVIRQWRKDYRVEMPDTDVPEGVM